MNFSEIRALIIAEQDRQGGDFVRDIDLEVYISKLQKNAEFLVHYIDGCCAAFSAFYCNDPDREQAYITLLITSPEFRGRKLASSLVDGVLSVAQERGFSKCNLEVKKDNLPAITLYKKKGFIIERKSAASLFMSRLLFLGSLEQ